MKSFKLSIIFLTLLFSLELKAQEFSKCKFRQAIQLNTSAAGAGVKGDVYNLHLAVVLNEKNFNFTEANRTGSDIRFSKANDTGMLPHRIENWDKEKKSAMIWVRVDHIRGNNPNQPIYRYWGDVAAQDDSDSKTVFNTNEGFVGFASLIFNYQNAFE